jgi:hypothetical protein
MLHAIDAWNPSFVPWRERDYEPMIVRGYAFSSREAPFAVLGDYNGDGRVDVAIDGHTKTQTLTIVLLSNRNDGYRVIVIRRGPLLDPKKEPLWMFLGRRIPPGTELGFEPPAVKPKYDAFEREYGEKGAEAFYWDGRKFRSVLTAD